MFRVLSYRRPDFPDHVATWVRELIGSCWSIDPTHRPSFSEILSALELHQFAIVDGVDSDEVRRFLSSVSEATK
jgi:hypothetical protein